MDGALLKKEDGINLLCTKKTQDAYCSAITKSMYIFIYVYPLNQSVGGAGEERKWTLSTSLFTFWSRRNSIRENRIVWIEESTYITEYKQITYNRQRNILTLEHSSKSRSFFFFFRDQLTDPG